MKKLNLLCVLLLTITLFSCSSDDDSTVTTEINNANLVGKWQLTASTTDGKELSFDECQQMDFNEYAIKENGEKIVIITEHAGPDCTAFTSEDYLWELSGNTLITDYIEIPDSNYKVTSTIIELNNTTLKLESKSVSDRILDETTGEIIEESKEIIIVITYKRI